MSSKHGGGLLGCPDSTEEASINKYNASAFAAHELQEKVRHSAMY